MSYILDRPIMEYVEQERARCAALVNLVRDEPEFLLYCINAPWHPKEIDVARRRFGELASADDFEDLM